MISHRERVLAAVERHLAGTAPAGFWPIDARYPHVTVAGAALACSACRAEGRAPLPREGQAAYSAACEAWLADHRDCQETVPVQRDPEGGTR